MNKYTEMLHEIEAKKQDLEQRIAAVVQAEISQWQQENNLPVREVYIDLENVSAMGEPKRYEVTAHQLIWITSHEKEVHKRAVLQKTGSSEIRSL